MSVLCVEIIGQYRSGLEDIQIHTHQATSYFIFDLVYRWIRQISHPLYTRPQLSSLLKSAESVGAEQSKDGEIEKKLWGQIGEMVEWCLENEREGSGKEKKN